MNISASRFSSLINVFVCFLLCSGTIIIFICVLFTSYCLIPFGFALMATISARWMCARVSDLSGSPGNVMAILCVCVRVGCGVTAYEVFIFLYGLSTTALPGVGVAATCGTWDMAPGIAVRLAAAAGIAVCMGLPNW